MVNVIKSENELINNDKHFSMKFQKNEIKITVNIILVVILLYYIHTNIFYN